MNCKVTLIIFAMFGVSQTATADLTGNGFLEFCGTPHGQGVICTALVTGLVAGFNSGHGAGMQGAIAELKGEGWAQDNQEFLEQLFSSGRICLSDRITPDDARDVVIQFFRDHPGFGDRSVGAVLLTIFQDYRCDRK